MHLLGAKFRVHEATVLVDMKMMQVVYDVGRGGAELYIDDAQESSFKVVKRYFLIEKEAIDGMSEMLTDTLI